MLDRVVRFALITVVAMLVWLFAEAESLGEASLSEVSVRLSSASPDRLVTTPPEWRGRVSVDLRGSRQAIEEARISLVEGIRLTPGMAGVPDGGGTVDLLSAIGNVPKIVESGVEVISVTPIRTEIRVRDMVTVDAPIRAELAGVRVAGGVDVAPPMAQVRLPEDVYETLIEELEISCVPAPEAIDALPESGPASLTGRLVLPPELRGVPGVGILEPQPPTARLEFAVFSTITTADLDIVPVQVSMPSIEVNEWRVALSAENAAISATITGPRSLIQEIADVSTGRRLVAILYLRSDELNIGITSKSVSFGLIGPDGSLVALPESVSVEPSTETVRFTIERAREASGADGVE